MPITKSAIKKNRQDIRRNARNRLKRESIHDAIKAVESAAKKGVADISAALAKAYKTIDKGVKTGILHKNNGANKKSRLAKLAAKSAKK